MENRENIEFADYLVVVCGKSANTARAYLSDLEGFARYCWQRGEQVEESLTRTGISLYLLKTMEKGQVTGSSAKLLSNRSAARIISSLKAYGEYLVFRGAASENPVQDLQPPKYSRKLPDYYTADEIIGLVSAFDNNPKPAFLRNSAILHLLYSAGLRVSECAALDVNSLSREGLVRISGKGGREREVPYGSRAWQAIQRYLAEGRPRLSTARSGTAAWLNLKTGGRLTDRAMRNILDEAALLCGLVKPVSPHKLRHACATHMLEGGADIRLLQEFLGHASLSTTQVYTQVTRTHLRDVYLETHPRATKSDPDD